MGTRRLWLVVLLTLLQYAAVRADTDPCEQCPSLYPTVCYSQSMDDCFPGSVKVLSSTSGDPPCRKLTCPDDHYLTTNLAATKFADEGINEIKCNSEAKWMINKTDEYGKYKEVEITSAVCKKKVSCQLTNPIKSDCTGLEAWECKEIDLNDDIANNKTCGDHLHMFVKLNAEDSSWSFQTNIICDFTRGVWKRVWVRGSDGYQVEADLQAINQAVCAIHNPYGHAPDPCTLCPPPSKLECDSATGCELGGPMIKRRRFWMTCEHLRCSHGEFFITDKGISRYALTCNDDKKWTMGEGVVVTSAACIKKFSCISKTLLKSDCTGLDDWGCVQVDLTNDKFKTCELTKRMFFKDASGTTWEETTSLSCNEMFGVWKRGPQGHQVDMQDNDQIICADSNPSQPTLDSCELCPSLPHLECDLDKGCHQGGQIIEQSSTGTPPCKKLTCPVGEFLLTNLWKDGDQEHRLMQTKINEIRCDNERKWMTVGMGEEDPVESAVCIKRFSCHLISHLKSDCTGLDDWGCEELNLNKEGSLSCEYIGEYHKMFFKNKDGTWKIEAGGDGYAPRLVCDLERGVWKRGRIRSLVDVPYDDGQVICALANPSEPPSATCLLCPPLPEADCDYFAEGCELGGPSTKRIVDGRKPATACKTFTCEDNKFFLTDQGVTRQELTCNNEKKWTINGDTIVNKALCIERISCIVKTPLKSDCTGLDDWGCVQVDLTNMSDKICVLPSAMFFKAASGTTWEETTNLYCDEMIGVWRRGPVGHQVDMQANDQVICADSNPSQPALDPCLFCAPVEKAECDIATGCDVGGPITEGNVAGTPACKKLTCPAGEFLITDLASANNAAESVSEIQCDSNKKWMTVGLSPELEVGGAVCIKTISCIAKTPLKSDCSGLDKWGCEKVDLKNDDSKSCGGTKTMFVKSDVAEIWTEGTKLVCDFGRGVWKRGPDGQQIDMQSGDQVICADSDPSPTPCELCPPLPLADCDADTGCELGGPFIVGNEAGTPPCKKLTCDSNEYLITNFGYSKKALTCNDQKTWIMKRKVVDKAVCIKKISCIKKTPLKSDCSGLADWGCLKVDLTNDEEKICDSNKEMFFKTATGTTWEEATSLACDEASGVWQRGPEEDQVNMHENEQVICANSNPSEPTSGRAKRFKHHHSKAVWPGDKYKMRRL